MTAAQSTSTREAPRPVRYAGRMITQGQSSQTDRKPISLHPGQRAAHYSPARFRIIVAGRRFGKTHLVCVEMILAAASKPGQIVWYVAPTYSMAKQIAWAKLKELIPASWLRGSPNETGLRVTLKNGSQIILRGADRPDSARGVGIHFLVLDEYQDMKPEIWTAIRPTLTDTRGKAILIGTPKGYNHLWEVYRRGIPNASGDRDWDYQSWQFKTADSPFIDPDEIDAARRDLDAVTFRQEYEASFESMAGRIYPDFDQTLNVKPCLYDPNLPILIGQDFNINPMTSVILQVHGEEVWVTGEMSLPSASTEDVCRELINELGWDVRERATIFPDPAGNSRQHARGESDIQIFREWGFQRILFRAKHPPVRDRIMAVNRLVCDASGRRRLFVDPSCKHVIESLSKMVYKEGTAEPDKGQNIDHPADALGYVCEYEYPIRRKFEPLGYSH